MVTGVAETDEDEDWALVVPGNSKSWAAVSHDSSGCSIGDSDRLRIPELDTSRSLERFENSILLELS